MTPLVQPNRSCTGYSPPPGSSRSTLYFSNIMPVLAYTRRTVATQRQAMSRASLRTAIHCRGAQPFGASHCRPISIVVVTIPPGTSKRAFTTAATRAACWRVASPAKSG